MTPDRDHAEGERRRFRKTIPAALLMGALADACEEARWWANEAAEPEASHSARLRRFAAMRAVLRTAAFIARASGLPFSQWPMGLRMYAGWEMSWMEEVQRAA